MPNWTLEQQQAINEQGTNIIVSAGAGSGKTAVLSERVLRKLENGIHIDKLLILTFTNAAAKEMKDRIRRKIKKNENLKEELNLIDSAYITTFDSFALSIVKKYHTRLNVTNNIKITDDVIIDIRIKKILDEIMDEKYLLVTKSFSNLINNFCLKDDKDLKKYILTIYKKICLKYDKSMILNNFLDIYYSSEKIDSYIDEYMQVIKDDIKQIERLLIDLNDYFDGDVIVKMEDAYKRLLSAATYEQIRESLDIPVIRLPKDSPIKGKNIKQAITNLKDEIKELTMPLSIDEIKDDILKTRENVREIIEIIKQLDERLEKEKEENDIYNFTDIAHLAIKVVEENSDIREEIKNSFNEILIDEYQDTSDTQERFISLIANNNTYMVGDIKQSIYRFRNANPYIFKNKYDMYSKRNNGIKIDLLKNFRSREEVLNNINLLFSLFMDDEIGGANYQETHKMVFGNKTYQEEGWTEQNYNMEILTYERSTNQKISADEQEIFLIGKDIKEKVKNKYQIFDKDNLVLRDVKYSDFVILLDKSTKFDLYKKIFEYLEIPLYKLIDESIKKDNDILVIKNLLKLIIKIKTGIIDTEFKYSYLSVARSFLYKMDDCEIYNLFIDNEFVKTDLYNKCLKLSEFIDITSPKEFFYMVLDEFNYDEKLITVGNMKQNRVREEYFYNLIDNFELVGNTIYDFIDYLDEIFSGDYDLKFSLKEDSSNSCKIMTIHKSKGLEFPICYFAGFSSKFNLSELKEKIIYDNKYGLILPVVNGYYKDTILKTLLKINTKKEEISEKIRLLYVALTRAEEKMILVMEQQEEEDEVRDIVPVYNRLKYSSFLSIMKSIYTVLLPYEEKIEIDVLKDYIYSNKKTNLECLKTNEVINVEELNIVSDEQKMHRFSKDTLSLISKDEQEKMDIGTRVHEILEEIDFKNFDVSTLDANDFVKEKISSFLNQKLICEHIDEKMYKEYEFTYLEDDIYMHGIIDLMIECSDKIIIIDYKLKNIDDSMYDRQLNGYRDVISKKTNKDVYCYLYSIIDEKFREIQVI